MRILIIANDSCGEEPETVFINMKGDRDCCVIFFYSPPYIKHVHRARHVSALSCQLCPCAMTFLQDDLRRNLLTFMPAMIRLGSRSVPDVLTKTQRSYNMSQIKAKNTKVELLLRRSLFGRGVRSYRIHCDIVGKPDIAFPKKKIAVFVDGCFWHRCPIHFVEPKTRPDFWLKKIESNFKRDRAVDDKLRSDGWQVLRFWEHEIVENLAGVTSKIIDTLVGC